MGQTYITKKLKEPQLKFVNCPSRIQLGFTFLTTHYGKEIIFILSELERPDR